MEGILNLLGKVPKIETVSYNGKARHKNEEIP